MNRKIIHGLTLLSTICMLLSAYAYRPGQTAGLPLAETLWLLGGGLLLVVVRLRGGLDDPSQPVARVPWQTVKRHHLIAIGLGVAVLFTVSQANRPTPGLLAFAFGVHHGLQLVLLLAGWVLVAWGLLGGWPSLRRPRWRQLWPLLAITGFGLFLRLIQLEYLVHSYVDETHFAEAVTRLWDRPDIGILGHMNPIASFSWLYAYGQHISMNIFGTGLAGLRMLSAIVGTLTIPALYALARVLFNKPWGLVAALLLATFPPHIHISRMALNNVMDPLLGCITLTALILAMRHDSRRYYALAGIALGLTQYFYEGGRAVYPALVVVWIVWFVVAGWNHPNIPRPSRRGLLLMGIAALLFAMPVLLTLLGWHAPLVPRLEREAGSLFLADLLTGENGLAQLQIFFRERVNPPLLHFIHLPDASGLYYGGQTGLILTGMVPLFLAGVFFALWRWRYRGGLLLLWIGLTVAGNSLIKDNVFSARYVVAYPVVVLLMVLALRETWALMGLPPSSPHHDITDRAGPVPTQHHNFVGTRPASSAGYVRYAAVGLLMLMALGQVAYYFGPHMDTYNRYQVRPTYDHQDAGFRAMNDPTIQYAYLLTLELTLQQHIDTMYRVEAGPDRKPMLIMPAYDFPFEKSHLLPRDGDMAFFIPPDDRRVYQQIEQVYGQWLEGPTFSPYNIPRERQYAMYVVRWPDE